MVVSLRKGYHMEHPNVHLTPQKTYIQQDVQEINNPPPHAESVISEPAQGGINILSLSTLPFK